jgi:DEAD/DEAH box helicase domain-containing protein
VQRLTGMPVTVVDQDGSPRGPREFALWNPPVVDGCGGRRSATSEASLLLAELVKAGIRNITFTKSRRSAEVVYLHARDTLERQAPEAVPLIAPYRAGYLPEERRRIEQALFGGRLLGVTSTTALELGVDVGKLDATVLTGYPGTLASVWQQAGRAGRGRDPALSILIAVADPLDQYLMRHPDEIFGRPVENALIDPVNPYILPQHLLCASYELPLSSADEPLFGGPAMGAALEGMAQQGQVRAVGDRWFYAGTGYPAQNVNIRSISGRYFSMLDRSRGSRLLETLEPALAFLQAHPGAVYLHQGETYLVEALDVNAGNIYVRPAEVDYYTQPVDTTDLRIVKSIRSWTGGPSAGAEGSAAEGGRVSAFWGQVRVTAQVIGFRRKQSFTDTVLGVQPLDLPPQSYETMALWFGLPLGVQKKLADAGLDLAGGLHALEHAAISMLPLYAMCDRNDIGGLSTPGHPDTGAAQIFIYDAFPGGVGISEKGFAMLPDLWRATLRLLDECGCEEGCPSCVQSPRCGNNNEPLDKRAAQVILAALLEAAGAGPGSLEVAPS